MRPTVTLSLLAALVMLVALPSDALAADKWDVNIYALMGKRSLGKWDDRNFEQDTSAFKEQDVVGGEIDFGPSLWPANFWFGYTRSEKKLSIPSIDFDSTLTMTEYYAGVRSNLIGFFVSGGAASIGGEFSGHTGAVPHKVTVEREIGLLLNAGVQWRLAVVGFAIDARALTGTKNNDYAQLALKAGLSF
ncbi:MAG: hypothetical protein HQK87_04550 [Nitrospinae bacterium]|nr:hypothetical protein [Nitrospinota bacterium]